MKIKLKVFKTTVGMNGVLKVLLYENVKYLILFLYVSIRQNDYNNNL